MSDAPELPERIWAWCFLPSKQDALMRGAWNDAPDRREREYIRIDIHEAVIAQRDAANARALRYKKERNGQAKKIADVQGLLTASEEAEARIRNQREEINRLQGQRDAALAQLATARADGYRAGIKDALQEANDALKPATGMVGYDAGLMAQFATMMAAIRALLTPPATGDAANRPEGE